MIAPRARPGLDYSDAFSFLFRRPNGWPVLLVGGILLMFFWLLIPLLVVLGYGVALGRATAAGDTELPRFDIGMAGDGLKAAVIWILYALPMFIIYAVAFVPFFFMGIGGSEPPAAFMFMTFAMMFLIMLYGLALAALQPALFAVFIADGTIGSCFNFQRIKSVLKHWGGDYAGAAAIVFGMSYLLQFGFIFLLIGIFFTGFYHLAFTSNVAGQLARPLIPGIAAAGQSTAPAPVASDPVGPGPVAAEPTPEAPAPPSAGPEAQEPVAEDPVAPGPVAAEPLATDAPTPPAADNKASDPGTTPPA